MIRRLGPRFLPLDLPCRRCQQPPGLRCRGPDGRELHHSHLKRKDDAALATLRHRWPPDTGAGTVGILLALGILVALNPRWYR